MTPRRARATRVRVYETVRTAHLERAQELAPARLLYARHRFDFDPQVAAGLDLLRAGPVRVALELVWRPPDVLEVNEPLMTSALARTVTAIVAARLAGAVRRRARPRVVTYAIENRDPSADRTGRLAAVRAPVERALRRLAWRSIDRAAFGTSGAEALYSLVLGGPAPGTATRVVPALPAPCSCPHEPRRPGLVLFVGALAPRKGVRQLMDAWPLVADQTPDARLVLIGDGPERPAVETWARGRQDVELVVTPPRATVHRYQRQATVVVLLSQPTARWREQVGLPIVEGLAHGCEVVATDQTGLADWLASHGHAVLEPGAPAVGVAAAISSRLAMAREPEAILGALPSRDGRLAADDWLTGDELAT